ncbi:glycosyltransferase [Labilibaculum sp. A4]|uniref:glycosyltransferase n=1 Tax=Labilibaculum euxinus TaxID=2686357 RepID=UPI000F61CD84|nr:glycosyltransferase [Labilibaculum euxinus]MDQ1772764.1 glycosyltransferase [Labilibaculum euxinus]MWN78279.1 glycosyltransferase [Labilibaculum euxinus]
MNILLVCDQKIPALLYGGTERIVWWLGEELNKRGHKISFLAKSGSTCHFAKVYTYDPDKMIGEQIPEGIDMVHVHFPIEEELSIPYISTLHGNSKPSQEYDLNTVFISKNHAERHGSSAFVYNGLDFDEYGSVKWKMKRDHFLFLGKASRSKKNLKGCVKIAKALNEKLAVIGGRGLPLSKTVRYKGFIGGEKKSRVINQSKALLFPVIWHEPFGLAIVESLYFGAPVFGSTYGSLPELIPSEVGVTSNSYSKLIDAARNYEEYNAKYCHEYVCDSFSVKLMCDGYLKMYDKVLNGHTINMSIPIHQESVDIRHYSMDD